MEAIKRACDTFDQIIFAEYTHGPAEELALGLVRMSPEGLDHVFYSDSGSTSVEVALKMALGFFYNIGFPRSRVVVMEHAYHGDSIGAMSVGARSVFNVAYEPILFSVDRIPFPGPGHEQVTLDAFEGFCQTGQVAAILVEPLVLGAGGMLMYSAAVVAELKRMADLYGVLFIADEVMTGWGRTGTLFACEQAHVAPDILCTSKGLTGGSIPLAATLCSRRVFEAYLSTDRELTFFHSSSYTANPIACAAALANLAVWRTEPVLERIETLTQMQSDRLSHIAGKPKFRNPRQNGTITAVDVEATDKGYLSEIGPKLRAGFRRRKILIRPLGNVIYLMPPYCVEAGDLDEAYNAIVDVVGEL